MNTSTDQKFLVASIADQKHAEIDNLTQLVAKAQFDVDQLQVIVNSLLAKSNQFNTYLVQADGDLATALANLNLGKSALANVQALVMTLSQSASQTGSAQTTASSVSQQTSVLIDKLIFTVEVINKLSQLITKQKSVNPLVPDALISLMAKANTDANNAIALTLTALQSCCAAQTSLLESQTIAALGQTQGEQLLERMLQNLDQRTQLPSSGKAVFGLTSGCDGIMALLQRAYQAANECYNNALTANNNVTRQLNFAQGQLADATTRLNSYQAGLAAATAAAYSA